MFGKLVVQGISAMLLLGAATMFASGAQAGAFRQTQPAAAPIVTASDTAQTAPIDLF